MLLASRIVISLVGLALSTLVPRSAPRQNPVTIAPDPLTIDTVFQDGFWRPRLHWHDVPNETGYVFERYRWKDGRWINHLRESALIGRDVTVRVDKPRATDSKGTETFRYRVRATGNRDNPWSYWQQVTVHN